MAGRKKSSFFIGLTVVLCAIAVLIFGAYLALDKLVVPKYFKDYGITDMHDLVAMVKTLYNSPKEESMLSNPYTLADQKNAVTKLIGIGFPSKGDNQLDYVKISEGLDPDTIAKGGEIFTDREIASILDQMLKDESRILESKLPNLNYLSLININVLELIIKPNVLTTIGDKTVYDSDSAQVSFTFKLDTSAVRNQMASAMDTPLFLLNMIVPKTMYITVDFAINVDEAGAWEVSDSHIKINNRSEKDSDILLNLLIKFVFPEEDQMTIDKFTSECGNIMIAGLNFLGHVRIYSFEGTNTFGIKLVA